MKLSIFKMAPQSRSPLSGLVAALLLCLTTQAGAAITIGAPTNHVASIAITGLPVGVTATSTLVPDPIVNLAPAAAGGLLDTTFTADLAQYPGWTLNFAGAALGGKLNVKTYSATDLGGGVGGANLNATYVPGVGDPPGVLTFLQVFVQTGTFPNATHVDPNPNDDTQPFYYTAAEQTANGLTFSDNPQTNSASVTSPSTRTTTFSNYLVTFDATKKTVTAYDGFQWGYSVVTPTPAPEASTTLSFGALLALGLGSMILARRRKTTLTDKQ